jgi:hypothetical protein
MTASCAPAAMFGGTGPHFTSSAFIGGRMSWANAIAVPARSRPRANTSFCDCITFFSYLREKHAQKMPAAFLIGYAFIGAKSELNNSR